MSNVARFESCHFLTHVWLEEHTKHKPQQVEFRHRYELENDAAPRQVVAELDCWWQFLVKLF